jgi:transposase-like protein
MHAAFRQSGALRKAPDALLPLFTNRVENENTFGPQSHGVGPCSEGWLKSWQKSALQSKRSTTDCPALGGYPNTREGFWSLLRSWLRPHRGISQEKLPLYLGFFEFVHNVRKRGKALLPALIELLVT